jgi:hypothetical protein
VNRIELPLSVTCFAFLREVYSMTLGVHIVLLSLSGCSHHLKNDLAIILDTKMDTINGLQA